MTAPAIELDHVFLFVPDERRAKEMMASAGLRVNYARAHPGQGTRNLCACLDDVFLELLWLDGSDISPESERITLGVRGRGQGSPIGVAWRGDAGLSCEPYAAPFLPEGATIPVARASLDPDLPFVFRAPSLAPDGTKPIDRTDGLAGIRQTPDLATLGPCELTVPDPGPVSALLAGFRRVSVREGAPGLHLTLLDGHGRARRTVDWIAAQD